MIILYGIANCDSIKKAKKWLTAEGLAFEFHDYKKQGISPALLKNWCGQVDWESLVNKRGTTWRKLGESQKEGLTQAKAIRLMQENTSLIKRPVLIKKNTILVGFDQAIYQDCLKD